MHSFLCIEYSPSGFQYMKTLLLVNFKFEYDDKTPWSVFHLKHCDGYLSKLSDSTICCSEPLQIWIMLQVCTCHAWSGWVIILVMFNSFQDNFYECTIFINYLTFTTCLTTS